MTLLKRTSAKNLDFVQLVKELDNYLKITDGKDHDFYNQYNRLEGIKNCVVIYLNSQPVGCGAFKEFDQQTVEIKRMFLKPQSRGRGLAEMMITELEYWAKELNYQRVVLETGSRQVEAVKFYHKVGYNLIPNYGQYVGMENSNCFEKWLK